MTSGIIEILLDSSAVTSLVGKNKTNDKWKVYPFTRPETEDPPFIVVAKTGNNPTVAKDCYGTLDYPSYDVLCYCKNFRDTEILHEAARAALDGMSSITAVCTFSSIWLITDRDAYDNGAQCNVHIATYNAEQSR